tara:strand:+ start:322 stop:1590 length:1269 start_codon:yes stop_codon:yes gene_type:complete
MSEAYKQFSGDISNNIGSTPTHMPGVTSEMTNFTRPPQVVNPADRLENSPGAMGGGTDQFYGNKPAKILQFPSDVANADPGVGNHGHYIMFYINEQDRASLRMGDRAGGGSVADDLNRTYSVPKYLKKYKSLTNKYEPSTDAYSTTLPKRQINDNIANAPEGFQREQAAKTKYEVVDNGKRTQGSTVRIKRAPTKRLSTAIAMYMPSSVQVTYGTQYQDTPVGAVTEQALNAYNDLLNLRGSDAFGQIGKMGPEIANSLQSFMLGSIGIIPGFQGVKEAFEMKEGNVVADRLELAFKGINKRNFQYTFKMIPKSRQEAMTIREIVFAFKANMLPEFVGGNRGGRRFIVPNTFDIQYMYLQNSNHFLHHISTCVLENMNVSYGGERYKTFEAIDDGAPPVETSITLNFKEMELITRERVFEGF